MGALEQYLKDCVRPAALSVHRGMSDNSILLAARHKLQTIHIIAYTILRQALHKNAVYLAFMDV
jgi:hypothetical protein